jgi:nucleoside-diphosphate-sugar epimerase
MIMKDGMELQDHILVTGGAGYIGSRLVGELLDKEHYVTVVDRLDFGGASILGYHTHPRFYFLKADVLDGGSILRAGKIADRAGAPPVSCVVHLAATVGFPACRNLGAEKAWQQNTDAVKVVHEGALKLGAERFIFSSTYSNYGLSPDGNEVTEKSALNPQSLYAETKIAAEEYLIQGSDSQCAPVIFRFATIYGTSPRMRFDLIVNQFVLEALYKEELLIYQKDYSRSFVHIQDVIEGILLGLEAPQDQIRGEIYNLGSKHGNHTKEEIVAIIRDALPGTRIQYGDHSFSGDMRDIRVSYSKIRKSLGFRATRTVKDGVQEVIGLLRSGLIEDPFADQYRNARLEIQ